MIPAGCEGLQFLPYLSGELKPHPDLSGVRRVHWLDSLPHGRCPLTRAGLKAYRLDLRRGLH